MTSPALIFPPILLVLQTIINLLAFLYLLPILIIRRFHSINNIFTVNVSIAVISCNMYWLFRLISQTFFPHLDKDVHTDLIFNYFSMMWNIQVPLSCLEVAVHRLCSIVYQTNGFFKKKQWAMICIGCQWIIGILSPLPLSSLRNRVRFPFLTIVFSFMFLDLSISNLVRSVSFANGCRHSIAHLFCCQSHDIQIRSTFIASYSTCTDDS